MTNDYYVRKSDVERLIVERVVTLKKGMARGKGLTNAIISLNAVLEDIEKLTCIKVGSVPEPTIWRRRRK